MAKNVKINGVTYNDAPSVHIPLSDNSGDAVFYDTSDATINASDIPTGKDGYGPNGKINGSMPVNGDVSSDISTKDGTVSIPAGHTTGGTVGISAEQKATIISDNIKAGAAILGVQGSSTVVDTALASGGAAAGNIMSGYSAFVNGAKVDGNATVPTVSQDSTTKVLTIS